MTDTNTGPIFDLSTSTHVSATPEAVYALVHDITRMGEWSPENTGGEWTSGDPGTVGARFHGHNSTPHRSWTTECEVVDARPGRRFAWSVLSPVDPADTSLWSFELSPDGAGTLLTQHYVMSRMRNGLRTLMSGMSDEQAEQFLKERRHALQDALRTTVEGIRKSVEDG